MAKKLVVCVDRDDDLGEKAKISGPIIGRENVLRAAVALGLKDPEDSDSNALFYAIKLYDDLVAEEDAEVAVITGSIKLGKEADRKISEQLDDVLQKTGANEVLLVSDGAEDEAIYPLIASRVKIGGVRTVYIKQSPNVEKFIHTVLRTLKEEKIQRKVYVPLGIALLIYSLASLVGHPSAGLGIIGLSLGIYFMILAYNLEDKFLVIYEDMKESITRGGILAPFAMVAMTLSIVGIMLGSTQFFMLQNLPIGYRIVEAVSIALLWLMPALIIYVSGKIADWWVRERVFHTTAFTIMITLIALNFLIMGSMEMIKMIVEFMYYGAISSSHITPLIIDYIIGIMIGIAGGYIYRYIKKRESVSPSAAE